MDNYKEGIGGITKFSKGLGKNGGLKPPKEPIYTVDEKGKRKKIKSYNIVLHYPKGIASLTVRQASSYEHESPAILFDLPDYENYIILPKTDALALARAIRRMMQ